MLAHFRRCSPEILTPCCDLNQFVVERLFDIGYKPSPDDWTGFVDSLSRVSVFSANQQPIGSKKHTAKLYSKIDREGRILGYVTVDARSDFLFDPYGDICFYGRLEKERDFTLHARSTVAAFAKQPHPHPFSSAFRRIYRDLKWLALGGG